MDVVELVASIGTEMMMITTTTSMMMMMLLLLLLLMMMTMMTMTTMNVNVNVNPIWVSTVVQNLGHTKSMEISGHSREGVDEDEVETAPNV